MEPPLLPLLLGAALGRLVQGLSGFAFGLAALAIWVWVLEPQVAGPLVVFGSLLGQLLAFGGAVRPGRAVLRRSLPFLVGGALGVPLGVAALRAIDPLGFKAALGMLLVVWCPAMLLLCATRPGSRRAGGWRTGWPARAAGSWAGSAG